jgi:hypothetical protein
MDRFRGGEPVDATPGATRCRRRSYAGFMSAAVDIAALHERIAEFGERAYLVTVGDDGAPHVVSVEATVDGAHLAVRVGKRTAANLSDRAAATLLWPPPADGAYSLLVDVTATAPVVAGPCALRPEAGVLHRVADADGEGPTCLPVEAADSV